MQNLPEVGKTYISQADPTLTIHVERVDLIDAGYFVECRNGIELFSEEWEEFQFTPLLKNQ